MQLKNLQFTIYNLQFSIIKILIFLTLFIVLHSLFIIPVHAQTPNSVINNQQSASIPYYPPSNLNASSPYYTDLMVHNMFHTFSCLTVGSSIIGQPCLTYQVTKNAQGAITSIPVLSKADLSGGLLGTTTSLLGALYTNQPIRTVDYLASVKNNFTFVKEAHAQGVTGSGNAVLQPVLALWQVSRNISYLIMII